MEALPENAFVSLMAIQKPLTLAMAAVAPSLRSLVKSQGEALTAKLLCAVLKLYNDSLNTSQQMNVRQLFECADLFAQVYPHETLKDLILCLKRAKMGLYGTDYNRIDATVITRFFRVYLEEKADWLEQSRQVSRGGERADTAGQVKALGELLTADQRHRLHLMTLKPNTQAVLKYVYNQTEYDQWLEANAETLDVHDLERIEAQAQERNLQRTLACVTKALAARRAGATTFAL